MDLLFFSLTPELVFKLLIIFCRIGSAVMMLPAIGEAFVSSRIRLLLALSISVSVYGFISEYIPKQPDNITDLISFIFTEVMIGIFIGTIVKLTISVMNIAGMIIATSSGLGSALLFDPTQETQGAIVGNFLGMLGVVLIFASDAHHTILKMFVASYGLFSANNLINTSEMSEQIINLVSDIFLLSLKIVAAQLIISMVILLGGGIISKLIPSLQIFFLLTPIQMLVSFIILLITLPAIMYFYLNYIHDVFSNFSGSF